MKIELTYHITFDKVVIEAPKFDRKIIVERIENKNKFEVFTEGGSYCVKTSFAAAISFAEKQIKSTIKNNDL